MSDFVTPELPSQPRTIKRGGGRVWIHAAATKGRYSRLRILTSMILLLVMYATPWLKVGDEPFLRLSFLSTSFVMFGSHVLIYEFYHFVLMALLLVLTLFMASAIYGRIWCGYACPQTVFVEQIFGRIETFFEGPAATRIAAEGRPLTMGRLWRKIGKQTAFVLVSASFAFSLVALFTGPEVILHQKNGAALGSVVLLTGLAWFDGAYWREQFCHIVCPYGRFQGVMQDAATRTIGYDALRGEPRKRGKDRNGAGDCIDCALCVRVCPSGIDIRQGAHQLECIGCAKCIDACDGVMKNLHQPTGLIRYDAVAVFASKIKAPRPKVIRPRIVIYGSLWCFILVVGVYQFVARSPFHSKVLHTRGGPPYVLTGDAVNNLFSIKIGNQWHGSETFDVSVALSGSAAVDPEVAARLKFGSPTHLGPLAPGREAVFPVLLIAPMQLAGHEVILTVRAVGSGAERQMRRQILGPSH